MIRWWGSKAGNEGGKAAASGGGKRVPGPCSSSMRASSIADDADLDFTTCEITQYQLAKRLSPSGYSLLSGLEHQLYHSEIGRQTLLQK